VARFSTMSADVKPSLTLLSPASYWKSRDPNFDAVWEEALERGLDALEDEVMRRAKDGVAEPPPLKGKFGPPLFLAAAISPNVTAPLVLIRSSIPCQAIHRLFDESQIWLIVINQTIRWGRRMEYRNEGDDKARALRSQLDLCQRLAQEVGDPELAEKLRNLAKKLETQATLQNAA
jgi:hypothetical protein